MISEDADESAEKIAIVEPQAYIEVQPSEQIDEKFNNLDDMSDASESDILSPMLSGFSLNDERERMLLSMNRILDLKTFLRYGCDPKSIWFPDPPILFRKRNYTEMDNASTADNMSRCTTPSRVPKRRRQK